MKLFAIFGKPVAHSRSPLMHNYVFKKLDLDACYTRVALEDGSLLREKFFSLKLSGANITVPYKEDAFRACDEVVGFAKEIGVVNTIINQNGRLIGYNTDADGFVDAISEFKDVKNILLLGAGGTTKALALKLKLEGFDVEVLNRSASKLEYFTNLHINSYDYTSFKIKRYDLIVNTTSAGLSDESLPAPKEILETILKKSNYVCDVIYGHLTPFLKLANSYNIPYKDGSHMLLAQGVLASELFTNREFSKSIIHTIMSKSFEF